MSPARHDPQRARRSLLLGLLAAAALLACAAAAAPAADADGCYGTAGSSPLELTRIFTARPMTPAVCSSLAHARRQGSFGVARGQECWIGGDLEAVKVASGPSTSCTTPCPGNAAQTCGGPDAINLFRTAAAAETTPPAASSDTTPTLLGCFADGAGGDRRMTPLWSDDAMTPTQCALVAQSAGFQVFGLKYHRECWGSNDAAFATALGASAGCDAPCLGDARENCGGAAALRVYRLPNFHKLGCFADSWDRMLPSLLQTSGAITAARCSHLADAGGFSLWGLQNSNQCWAGNDVPRATSLGPSSGCTKRCYDDPAGDCGGELATTVFMPGLGSPALTAPVSSRAFRQVGCFADDTADRALPRLLGRDARMTVDTCAGLTQAAGLTVFGVQWGTSCYAGTDEGRAKRHGAAASCTTPCWWHMDAPGMCGGSLASSLYSFAEPPPAVVPPTPPTPTPPPAVTDPVVPSSNNNNLTALGCFGDRVDRRALPARLGAGPDMTVDACVQLAMNSAARYAVVGLQYASECWASLNETTASRYGPSTACTMPCQGTDATGTCGGPDANSLYRVPAKQGAAATPPPPAAAIAGLQGATYRGCYADGDPRVVPIVGPGSRDTMTLEACAAAAVAAYQTVFALQYGGECFMSNDLAAAESLGALPEEVCGMPCGGNADQPCGGPRANALYSLPVPQPPTALPAFESLGCWTDDQVFDDRPQLPLPPKSTQRRMWRRLGETKDMDSWQCGLRAVAAGYPLFGLTSGETTYGAKCWGAFDVAHVTALGASTGCTLRCHTFQGADACGGPYAISLYRFTNATYGRGTGGRYESQGEFPVSAVHMMQVTGRDEFLLIDFLGTSAAAASHPPAWDGRNTTYTWVRTNNTARATLNFRDASCGMWIRLTDGELAGFSGYFGFSGVNERAVWATMLHHRHQSGGRVEDFGEAAMPFGRWYGGAVLLPDGRAYITGGDENGPGWPRALGSDLWDPAHKSYVGRATSMGANTPYLDLNEPLFRASNVGGYYPGMWPLHSGGLLFSQATTVQVINPATGAALAAAPPLPRQMMWEYPLSGSPVLLREPVIDPAGDVTLIFMVFGGGFQADYFTPCSDFALRLPLTVRCSVSPCTHEFGAWEVETMPGPRCTHDAALLPNGKVVIIGGTEAGFSNLDYLPNSCNEPSNEPWIYDPQGPPGRRFRRTGAYSRVPRFYHNSHLLTSHGDVLCGGSTIARGFTSYHMASFDVTPYTNAEFRVELFKPPYILGPRPAFAAVPNQIVYGATFSVLLAANTSASDIVAVVLSDPGTTTHSSNMASRSMQLAFSVGANGQQLTVTAPASIYVAQPGFYLLFAVSRDDSYSVGAWLRLRGPWGSTPPSLPPPAQFVPAASSQFEDNYVPWSLNAYGTPSASVARAASAAGSGGYGLFVTAGNAQPIVVAGPAISLTAGARVHVYLWARAPLDDAVKLQLLLLDAANLPAASAPLDAHADITVTLAATWQFYMLGGIVVNATGSVYPALRIAGLTAGQAVALDDAEVFTLSAADAAASLARVRAGTPVGNQIAPPSATAAARRRLLQTAAASSSGNNGSSMAWSMPPALPAVDDALAQQLQQDLERRRKAGQDIAVSALRGVRVGRMASHRGGPHGGAGHPHQHPEQP